jgi:hypothetical protein
VPGSLHHAHNDGGGGAGDLSRKLARLPAVNCAAARLGKQSGGTWQLRCRPCCDALR